MNPTRPKRTGITRPLVMAAIIVSWGVFSIFTAERVPFRDGFGWDGDVYRSLTTNLWEPNPDVAMYHGKRLLPCVAVRYTLEALHLPVDGEHIFLLWRCFNMLLFVAILWTLLAICNFHGIGAQGQWILFLCLTCSYFHLKQCYYSPITTDLWAVALLSLALLCYFKQRWLGVIACTFLGSFTWAVFPYFGGLLILFPYRPVRPSSTAARQSAGMSWAWGLSLGAALALMAVASLLYWGMGYRADPPGHFSRKVLPVSILSMGVLMCIALKELLSGDLPGIVRELLTWKFLGRFASLVVLLAVLTGCYRLLEPFFTHPMADAFFPVHKSLLVLSVAKPLLFLVSEIVFYGPVIILIALYWPQLARQANQLGPAMLLQMVLGLYLSLCPEPRYCLLLLPLALVLLAKVLDQEQFGPMRLAGFALLGVFMSKVWLPLNWAAWPTPEQFQYPDVFRFPMQVFFMNYGWWMNTQSYLIQAGVAVAAGLFIKFVLLPRSAQIAHDTNVAPRMAA